MKKVNTTEDELYRIGIVVLLILPLVWLGYRYIFLRYFPQIPCAAILLFDMYCPGCGGTRAVFSLLQGHFLKALWYHPGVVYSFILYAGFMLTQTLYRLGCRRVHPWKYHDWYLWGFVLIFALNFIIKNVLRLCFGIMMSDL